MKITILAIKNQIPGIFMKKLGKKAMEKAIKPRL